MPDSSDIDNALSARLGADAALLALCPNGVYWDVAPTHARRYVLVSLVSAEDETTFEGTAIERVTYAVKAVLLNTATAPGAAPADAKAAAGRIHTVLHEQPLTVPGYAWMTTHRDEASPRIRYTERDDADPTVLWFHRGGSYQVEMALEHG